MHRNSLNLLFFFLKLSVKSREENREVRLRCSILRQGRIRGHQKHRGHPLMLQLETYPGYQRKGKRCFCILIEIVYFRYIPLGEQVHISARSVPAKIKHSTEACENEDRHCTFFGIKRGPTARLQPIQPRDGRFRPGSHRLSRAPLL